MYFFLIVAIFFLNHASEALKVKQDNRNLGFLARCPKNAFESPIVDQRCFSYKGCVGTNGCTRFTDVELTVLKQTCLTDSTCLAVSCEDQSGDGNCRRGFLSTSCDSATADVEKNWAIHLVAVCYYVELGQEVYCENSGWPNSELTNASNLEECQEMCNLRDDCSALSVYTYSGFMCYLHLSTCNNPAWASWGAEDGAVTYKAVCE